MCKPGGCAENAEHRAKACTEQRLLLIQNAKPQVEGKRTKAAVQPDAGERIGASLLALCLPGDCVAAFESRRFVVCAQRLAHRHGVTPAMLEPGRRLRILGVEEGGGDKAGNEIGEASCREKVWP